MKNTHFFFDSLLVAMWYMPTLLICVFALSACDSDSTNEKQLLVEYRESGGMDMYKDGDSYGHVMYIYTCGYVVANELIYTIVGGERKITETPLTTCRFRKEKVKAVSAKIENSNFDTFPSSLPDASPHEINMRTPASSVRIASEALAPNNIKVVNAYMGADHKHYPDGFLELLRYLRTLLEEVIE